VYICGKLVERFNSMFCKRLFMKLLISPINKEEAIIASRGGADIVDVKNPKEGSLGANFPWVIRDVKEDRKSVV
jgi:uncharacterized protein (UPF0264 family)